jgi:hypothetical protein
MGYEGVKTGPSERGWIPANAMPVSEKLDKPAIFWLQSLAGPKELIQKLGVISINLEHLELGATR